MMVFSVRFWRFLYFFCIPVDNLYGNVRCSRCLILPIGSCHALYCISGPEAFCRHPREGLKVKKLPQNQVLIKGWRFKIYHTVSLQDNSSLNFVGVNKPQGSLLVFFCYLSESQCYLKRKTSMGRWLKGSCTDRHVVYQNKCNFFPQWVILLHFYKFWLLIRKLRQNLGMKCICIGISDTVMH